MAPQGCPDEKGILGEVISQALALASQRYLKRESDTKGMVRTYSGGEVMTIQDREKRVRRILSKQGWRLIISRRRRAYYTIMHGSEVENETDFLDIVESSAVSRVDPGARREIDIAEHDLRRRMIEVVLKRLDK